MTRRTRVVLGVLATLGLGCGGAGAWVAASMPSAQGPLLQVERGVLGVDSGGSYAWLVPTATGAFLVDAGVDPEAAALRDTFEQHGVDVDDVETVLLTHAHADHTLGLEAFPEARVLVGKRDLPLLLDEGGDVGPLPRVFRALMGAPHLGGRTIEVLEDGQELDVDGVDVRVIATPGHTSGSVSFLVEDRWLFVGDAVFAYGDGVDLGPGFITWDEAAARQSAERLLGTGAAVMADGHAGLTQRPDDALEAFLRPGG